MRDEAAELIPVGTPAFTRRDSAAKAATTKPASSGRGGLNARNGLRPGKPA